jgi:WD40 repeat protein
MRSCRHLVAVLAVWLGCTCGIHAQAKPRVDAYGDPLPEGALMRIGTVRFTHGARIEAIFFSKDGKTVTAVDRGHNVRVWEAATGKELRHFALESVEILGQLLRTDDGKWFVSETLKGTCIWDAETGKLQLILDAPLLGPNSMVLLPDSRTILFVNSRFLLTRWDIITGKQISKLAIEKPMQAKESEAVGITAFSADGKWLVATTGSERRAFVWDTVTGKIVAHTDSHPKQIQGLRISPDGKWLATGCFDENTTVRLWQTGNGVLKQIIDGCTPHEMVFSPDSRWLLVQHSKLGNSLYSVETGNRLDFWFESKREREGTHFVFSPDSKLLAAASGSGSIGFSEGKLLVWNTATGKRLGTANAAPVPFFLGREMYSADSKSYFISDTNDLLYGCAKRYFVPGGELAGRFPGFLAALPQDGKRLICFVYGQLVCYELVSSKQLWKYSTNFSLTNAVLSADGSRIVLETRDQNLIVADVKTGRLLPAYPPLAFKYLYRPFFPQYRDNTIAISPDLEQVAHVNEEAEKIEVRDWKTGKLLHEFKGYFPKELWAVYFSPDGEYLIATTTEQECLPILWQLQTGSKVPAVPTGEFVGFSPGSSLLALRNEQGYVLWDIAHRKIQSKLPSGLDGGIRFSFDGKLVARFGPDQVAIHDMATGEILQTISGPRCEIVRIYFAPNTRTLATTTYSEVLLWDLTGLELAARQEPLPLAPDEFPKLWKSLASRDAPEAYRALWKLVAASDAAVAELGRVLAPTKPVADDEVVTLIADLDSKSFAKRETAMQKLSTMEAALPHLHTAAKQKGTLEKLQRLEKLITKLDDWRTTETGLQHYRAIQVLEYIGSDAARAVLQRLAAGAADTMLTREARASLARLAKRPTPSD